MLPRGHRGRFRKRQGNLVLQPGTGILFGGGGQSSASTGSQQPTQASAVTGTTNSSPTSAATQSTSSGSTGPMSSSEGSTKSQSPSKTISQSLATSSSLSVAPSSASLSSILFGPSEMNGVLEPDTTDTSNSLTESTPSPTLTSSSQPITSSSVSSSSITNASSLSNVLSTSTASTSIQSSAMVSATPVSDVTPSASGHSAQFYAGIVFLAIVVVACVLSIVAWLLRSRRSRPSCRPSWCCGSSVDDDVGGQEANMGLGLYLEKPFDDADSIRMPSISAPNNLDSPRSYTLPAINRISDSPYPAMMRPPPVHVRMDTSEPPGQVLGPLQVKNYMAGDFSSSSENLAKPYSPRGTTGAFGAPNGYDAFGSSRFLAPASQTSPAPWTPLNMRSVRTTELVKRQSRARGSLTAHPDDGHDSDIPSLPSPHFDRQDVLPTGYSTTDGWGATLRSSFFSALSAVKGQPTKTAEDRFTSLPSRGSSASRRKMPTGVGNIFPQSFTALKDNFGVAISHSVPDFQPEKDFSLASEKGFVEDESHNTTAPLSLRKKNTLDGLGLSDLQDPRIGHIGRPASRASSVYTCTSGMPGGIASKKTLGRRTGGLSGPSQLSVRPAFLTRGSSGVSVTSFNSDSSEDAQGQTDEEMIAKRVMMLRARRKKAMSRRTSCMRQPSSVGSRSGSKRREGQK